MSDILSSQPLRALVVDDDLDSVILLTTLLEMYGINVTAALCANQAMQELHSLPDILISDLAMPFIDGFELMRYVRSLPSERGGRIPAIAISAWVAAESQQRAIDSGFQMFLPKPYQPSQLIEIISQLTGWTALELEVAA